MQEHRQERVRSATRRMQRGRKTTGRIVASALGYPSDSLDSEGSSGPEYGGFDRLRLRVVVQDFFRQINDALAPDIVEPTASARAERVAALR
jgi:hypothetical protein